MSEKESKPKVIRLYKIFVLIFAVIATIHSIYFADTPQIDMRAVVTVLGLDSLEDGRFKACAHVLVPVSEGNTKSSQDLIEAEGSSIIEAIDNFNVINGSKVETAQCGMIIFGKTICDEDVLTPVKSLLSAGLVSAGVILISAERLEAVEFLEVFSQMSKASSSNLNSFTSFFENSLYMPSLTMAGFLSESITESGASYLPSIELKEEAAQETKKTKGGGSEEGDGGGSGGGSGGGGNGGGNGGGGSSGGSGGGGENSGSSTKIRSLSNIVIFKDGRRVGVLGEEESEGMSWSDGKSKRGFLQLETFEEFGREYKNINGEVAGKHTKITYCFKDNKPLVKIKVMAKINLIDRHAFTFDLDKSKISERDQTLMLNRRMCDKIRFEIESAVNAVKRLDTDFMGFRYGFYRLKNKQIAEYEKNPYNDFIRDFEVEYDIKCDVR